MTKGLVYILTNESMPGIVKIGMTTRTAESRAAELYQTGVPTPFKVFEIFQTFDCEEPALDRYVAKRDRRIAEYKARNSAEIEAKGATIQ